MVLSGFLTELIRRKVYKVAVVYAAVAWLLLQVADVFFPLFGLPDWSVTLVLALSALGFPIAIILAWAFDLTPEGAVRAQPVAPEEDHPLSTDRIAEFVVIVVLVLTVGYLYLDRLSLQERVMEPESAESGQALSPEQYRAIAVLPFVDMSEQRDQSWFAEGIAEELLNTLAQIEELHVMARTSSFAFKDSDKTIAEIADILGVQAVLEGSVRRSGERVRVSAQLIDASNGYHLWSGSYERQLTDIFRLQDELARAIVQVLRVELGVDATRLLVAEQTVNPEAYNWFIRGRASLDWATPEELYQSSSYFEKAVEADPDYAMAWGFLSFSRMVMLIFSPFDEVGPTAIAAYERALSLDPEESQALAVKALMTQLLEHDWEAAGRLYQRANMRDSSVMPMYAMFYLNVLGRQEQAIRLLTDSEKRDPLHAGSKANLAATLYYQGHYEEAISKALEALELNPRHSTAITYLIMTYVEAGNYAAVQHLLESIPAPLQELPRIKAAVGMYHAARGDEEKAREIYRELLDSPLPAGPFFVANLALDLGEVEEAIDLMERQVVEKRWTQLWSRFLARAHETLRDHPRYLALLKRIGLDDESVAALNSKMSFD